VRGLAEATEEALGESLAASFRLWEESDPGSELLQCAVQLAMDEAVMPEATTLAGRTKEWPRRGARGMAPRVLAIVGRAHVAPLIALLEAAKPVKPPVRGSS
jgi:hypothetical protein